jgi:hypothetical protein
MPFVEAWSAFGYGFAGDPDNPCFRQVLSFVW